MRLCARVRAHSTASTVPDARGDSGLPAAAAQVFHEPTGEELELAQSVKRRERRLGRRQRQPFVRRVVGFRTGKRSERIPA